MTGNWSMGGLESVPACPACASALRAPDPFRIRDHLGTGAPDIWQLWRCADCDSIFLDPRPDDASIPATYGSYYTHLLPRSPQQAGTIERGLWAFFRGYLSGQFGWQELPAKSIGFALCAAVAPLRFKLDYLARHLFVDEFPAQGLLFDYGCGNGEFLVSAAKMGWTVAGLDLDPKAVDACRAQGFEAVFTSVGDLPANFYGAVDVVTSGNCIEHLNDIPGFLALAGALLKPQGRLWIATPNPEGLGIRIFGRFWRGLEPSRHLCVPSQRQLVRMLEQAGYDNIRLLRRGSHGKTIARESAAVAVMEAKSGAQVPAWLPWMAWPLRLFASTLGALIPSQGEETVVVARRRPDEFFEEKAT